MWPEFLLLVIAWAFAGISYYFNHCLFGGAELFSRSGSIVVLLTAISEYRLRILRDRQIGHVPPETIEKADRWTRDQFRPKAFLGQRVATVLAHLSLLLSTALWGYGDFL